VAGEKRQQPMKISTFIKRLEELQKKHGDIRILLATEVGVSEIKMFFSPRTYQFDEDRKKLIVKVKPTIYIDAQ
jgi:hypothetical protein